MSQLVCTFEFTVCINSCYNGIGIFPITKPLSYCNQHHIHPCTSLAKPVYQILNLINRNIYNTAEFVIPSLQNLLHQNSSLKIFKNLYWNSSTLKKGYSSTLKKGYTYCSCCWESFRTISHL